MSSDVEVLIPHWNGVKRLCRALGALRSQTLRPTVCVIDNGSTDVTPEVIPREFPEVRYLRLGHNHGFGAAINRGAATSDAPFLVLLNNDTEPDERFVETMLGVHLETGAEMVAGCLREPQGVIDSAGIEIDRSLIAYDALHGQPYETGRLSLPQLLAPTAGAAGINKADFDRIGGFDEAMFAYLEDVELGIRWRLAGGRCVGAPGAFAWHHHSATLGSGSADKNRLMGESRRHLLWKHGANLTRAERIRGFLIDAIVYSGQAVIDRNAAGMLARLSTGRRHDKTARPRPNPRFAEVPRTSLSVREALSRKLARRR